MQKKVSSGTAGWEQVYEYPYASAFQFSIICQGVFLALASKFKERGLVLCMTIMGGDRGWLLSMLR